MSAKTWPTPYAASAAIAGQVNGKLAASWGYRYADGREALRVFRFALPDGGKTYRPIRPEGDGWTAGDPPGQLPLYRLANLDGKASVFVVEGEKCVEVVVALGLAATCSAHGASSPKKTDWTPLAGRNVAILPDNDIAGKSYAETVAGLLVKLDPPARVKIVDLPIFGKGDDVVEWAAVEARPADDLATALIELADAAPEWRPEGEELPATARASGIFSLVESRAEFGDQLPPTIIEGLLREGEILNIIASPKAGKSFLVGNLAFAVASGSYWLRPEWRCQPGNVVIIDGELPPKVLNHRLTIIRAALNLPESIENRITVWPRWGTPPAPAPSFGKFSSPLAELHGGLVHIRALQPRMIIIDPFYLFLPIGASENDNAEIGSFYRELNALTASIPGSGTTLVHHASKGLQGEKAITDVGAGAGAFSRGAATHFVLRDHEEQGLFVAEARCRTFPPPDPITLRFTYPTWTPTAHDPLQLRGRAPIRSRAPETLSDDTFADLLNGNPQSFRSLRNLLQSRHNYSKSSAESLLHSIIDRHELYNLTPGQQKNCGQFTTTFGGKGAGFRFQKTS